MPAGPQQLGDARPAGGACVLRERAQRVEPDHLELDLRPGEPVADTGSSKAPLALGQRRRGRRARAGSRPAGRSSRRRARSRAVPSRPASRRRARRRRGRRAVRAPSKKTSLNSEVPVSWSIGADLDALLVHRDQQVGQAAVALRAGLGAGEHEAPVGQVRQRGPHLLPVDHPLGRRRAGPWSRRWRGRSRRRARSSPGTTAPRRPRSAAGSAASAPRCRRRSASGRAAPRRGG